MSTSTKIPYTVISHATTASPAYTFNTHTGASTAGSNTTYSRIPNKFTFSNGRGEISLNHDGTVSWGDDVTIDDAAELFAKSLSIGAEMAAGITEGTKSRVRDSLLEDLIDMSKDTGQLTTEDLGLILNSFKMVDKLKNIK